MSQEAKIFLLGLALGVVWTTLFEFFWHLDKAKGGRR